MSTSLGLIETKGLVAAIAAADKITKNNRITLIGKEITPPSLVTIKFSGEKAEVESALIIGEETAREMGAFIAKLLITSPHEELSKILNDLNPTSIQKKKAEIVKPGIKFHKEEKFKTEEFKREIDVKEVERTEDTISRLRKEAFGNKSELKKIGNKGKNKVEKKTNHSSIGNQNLDGLNVHKLRKLARSYENFPIKGREISKANRNELIKYFDSLTV